LTRLRNQQPARGTDTELPYADFHTFAAAYGWTYAEWQACPDKILPYLATYISSDQAVERHQLESMRGG
jgi:hypothetical protein